MEKKTEPILLEPEKMVWQNGRFRYKRPRYWYTDCRGCPHNTKNVQCALHNGCDEDVYNADVSTSILESVGDAYNDGRWHVSCTAGKIQLDGLRRG